MLHRCIISLPAPISWSGSWPQSGNALAILGPRPSTPSSTSCLFPPFQDDENDLEGLLTSRCPSLVFAVACRWTSYLCLELPTSAFYSFFVSFDSLCFHRFQFQNDPFCAYRDFFSHHDLTCCKIFLIILWVCQVCAGQTEWRVEQHFRS